MSLHKLYICKNTGYAEIDIGGAASFAPIGSKYIVQTPDATLTNEQALSALATGILKNTTTTGILSIAVASDLPSGIAYSQLTLTGAILNADLAGSITYGKLSLTNSIVNGDIVSLAWSKLTSTPTTFAGYGLSDTSANFLASLTNETGSGLVVGNTSPTLVTPTLGAALATSINGNIFTTGTYTLTGTAGKTLTFNNTLTLSGTDSSTLNIGTGGTLGTNAFLSTAFAPLASPTFTGTVTIPTGSQITKPNIIGTATNDDASAGSVGEILTGSLASASATSLTTATTKTITSVSLTAGDWDVFAVGYLRVSATTSVTEYDCSISSTNNTGDFGVGNWVGNIGPATVYGTSAALGDIVVTIPLVRKSLASTTTVYLVCAGTFTVSTMTSYGKITARRVR